MKKVTSTFLVFLMMLFSGIVFGQTAITESFEEYTVGGSVAQEAITAGHEYWTTWSNAPGGPEDAKVSDEQASEGTKSMKCTYGNDQILLLSKDPLKTGHYVMNIEIFVPTGKDGYFNVLHKFAGGGSEWALDVFINTQKEGTSINAGGKKAATFTCPLNAWVKMSVDVNLDMDKAAFIVAGDTIYKWKWSLKATGEPGERTLHAMDFFPPTSAAVSQFYIDKVEFKPVGGGGKPTLNVTPTSITKELAPGQVGNASVSIQNTGTSIGDWNAYIDYDITGGTTQGEATLNFDTDEIGNAIGSKAGAPLWEIAAKYTQSQYGANAMGMSINKVQFYASKQKDESSGITGPMKIRVYGHGSSITPGEMLAEVILDNPTLEAWNTVTLPTPISLHGQDVWVAVEMKQKAMDYYTLSCDKGPALNNGDWIRTDGGTWDQLHLVNPEISVNWHIRALCSGKAVPGTWVSIAGSNGGDVLPGQTGTIQVNFNAKDLLQTSYNSTIRIKTNDTEHPSFDIPVKLKVIGSPCAVPTNLVAKEDQSKMTINLTWEGSFEGGWITWGGEPSDKVVGTGGKADFSIAYRYEPSDLAPYEGMKLTKIQVAPTVISDSCTYSLRVWTGGNESAPGSMVVDQVVEKDKIVVGELCEIPLNTPVIIDPTKELWFGLRCNTQTGYPALLDKGPQVPKKGNMMYFNGKWQELTALVPDLKFNWYFKGYVAPSKGGEIALAPLTDNSDQTSTGTLKAVKTTTNATFNAPKADVTFNVYRDGVKIKSGLTEKKYSDVLTAAGKYCYTITTTCPEGEGLPSNESCATLLEPCNAPVVTAVGESQNSAPAIHLTWPAVPGAKSYKVFYNSTNVGNPKENSFYVTGITANKEYCFTVKTVCENGLTSEASDPPACATYKNSVNEIENDFSIFPNPANAEVTVKGENISHVAIYNMVGQLLETTASRTINTATYSNGIYIFRIITIDGNIVTKRIVINH